MVLPSRCGRARPRSCCRASRSSAPAAIIPAAPSCTGRTAPRGKGALLSGDIVQVVQDNKSVSFMWSFPNFIPLSAPRVEGVINALKPYKFDRIHGAFTDRTIWSDGKGVMERSAARYLKIIRGDGSYELQA